MTIDLDSKIRFLRLCSLTRKAFFVANERKFERLLASNGRVIPGLVLSTLAGVTVLTLITNMPVIGQVPFLGFLLGLLGTLLGLVISATGLGAVLLTRFGTRPYPSVPAYSFAGGPSSSYPSGAPAGGAQVRWAEPAPDVSEEEVPASEAELNAKIKATLAKAGKAVKDELGPQKLSPEKDSPEDELKSEE